VTAQAYQRPRPQEWAGTRRELLSHGVLCHGWPASFGRWDWVANTVLFGLYHAHKIWAWHPMPYASRRPAL